MSAKYAEGTSVSVDASRLHTLGLDRSDAVYRNYFRANADRRNLPTLESCVEAGWMVKETSAASADLMFRVTAAGKAALLGRKAP